MELIEHTLCVNLYYLASNQLTGCAPGKVHRSLVDIFSVDDCRVPFYERYTVVKLQMYCQELMLDKSFSNVTPIDNSCVGGGNKYIIDEFNLSLLKSIMYFRFLVRYDILDKKFKLRDNITCKQDVYDFFLDPVLCVTKFNPDERIHSDYLSVVDSVLNVGILDYIFKITPSDIFEGRVYVQNVQLRHVVTVGDLKHMLDDERARLEKEKEKEEEDDIY